MSERVWRILMPYPHGEGVYLQLVAHQPGLDITTSIHGVLDTDGKVNYLLWSSTLQDSRKPD